MQKQAQIALNPMCSFQDLVVGQKVCGIWELNVAVIESSSKPSSGFLHGFGVFRRVPEDPQGEDPGGRAAEVIRGYRQRSEQDRGESG